MAIELVNEDVIKQAQLGDQEIYQYNIERI